MGVLYITCFCLFGGITFQIAPPPGFGCARWLPLLPSVRKGGWGGEGQTCCVLIYTVWPYNALLDDKVPFSLGYIWKSDALSTVYILIRIAISLYSSYPFSVATLGVKSVLCSHSTCLCAEVATLLACAQKSSLYSGLCTHKQSHSTCLCAEVATLLLKHALCRHETGS